MTGHKRYTEEFKRDAVFLQVILTGEWPHSSLFTKAVENTAPKYCDAARAALPPLKASPLSQ